MRPAARVVAVLATASMLLGACTTSTTSSSQSLTATPSLSIEAPLTHTICDVSSECLSFGAQSLSSGETLYAAQWSSPASGWQSITDSAFSADNITTGTCSGTDCYLAGSANGRDVLYSVSLASAQSAATLTPITTPIGDASTIAISCASATQCGVIDRTAGAQTLDFSTTTDAGLTWSSPVLLSQLGSDTVNSLSCWNQSGCALLATVSKTVVLLATADGGTTWQSQAVPSTWSTASDLNCSSSQCAAIATSGTTSELVRTTTTFTKWHTLLLPSTATSLQCVGASRCVVTSTQDMPAALYLIDGRTISDVTVKDTPTPLTSISCGERSCVASGNTEVVRFHLPKVASTSKTTSVSI